MTPAWLQRVSRRRCSLHGTVASANADSQYGVHQAALGGLPGPMAGPALSLLTSWPFSLTSGVAGLSAQLDCVAFLLPPPAAAAHSGCNVSRLHPLPVDPLRMMKRPGTSSSPRPACRLWATSDRAGRGASRPLGQRHTARRGVGIRYSLRAW